MPTKRNEFVTTGHPSGGARARHTPSHSPAPGLPLPGARRRTRQGMPSVLRNWAVSNQTASGMLLRPPCRHSPGNLPTCSTPWVGPPANWRAHRLSVNESTVGSWLSGRRAARRARLAPAIVCAALVAQLAAGLTPPLAASPVAARRRCQATKISSCGGENGVALHGISVMLCNAPMGMTSLLPLRGHRPATPVEAAPFPRRKAPEAARKRFIRPRVNRLFPLCTATEAPDMGSFP